MLAGSLTQEDEDAVLAELEAITQVSFFRVSQVLLDHLMMKLKLNRVSVSLISGLSPPQGDVELPEVPSDELPEVPEASKEKPGLFSQSFSSS